jgi:hypothetical protein
MAAVLDQRGSEAPRMAGKHLWMRRHTATHGWGSREEFMLSCCLALSHKGSDTVGELKSAEICVSHMLSWKAKKLGQLAQEKVLLEL